MNSAKRGSTAGASIIDGGMKTSIAGIRNAIGMTTTTTAIDTEGKAEVRRQIAEVNPTPFNRVFASEDLTSAI
jgi:hypothetical protein